MNVTQRLSAAVFPFILFPACASTDAIEAADFAEDPAFAQADEDLLFSSNQLDVFIINNDAVKETVMAYRRDGNKLSLSGVFPTGGLGSGGGLGSQGALVLDESGRYLYAVNAGSNELSVFEVLRDHLVLRDIVASGGVRPVSLAVHDDLLYVVNAGSADVPGNVQGFRAMDGQLMAMSNAMSGLSEDTDVAPGQVGFNRNGDLLIVTEKATNRLTTFGVTEDGTLSDPTITASSGETPFGFEVTANNHLFVAEAFGGAEGKSAVSSYDLDAGYPVVISGSIPTLQTAACWLVASSDGRQVYTTNAGSDNLSAYSTKNGALSLLQPDGIGAVAGDGPIDLDFDAQSRWLYVLNGRDDTVSVYTRSHKGTLKAMSTFSGLPATTVGLAAR
jgi:6-phosphogluconolactonase (cycloisomerase 2 family)